MLDLEVGAGCGPRLAATSRDGKTACHSKTVYVIYNQYIVDQQC